MHTRSLIATLGLLLIAATALAAPKNAAYTTPDEAAADPDFAVQGEYVGNIEDDNEQFGVQVIALGDGAFEGVAYEGGLPGAGWDGGKAARAPGKRDGDVVVFKAGDEVMMRYEGGRIVAIEGDKAIGRFEKVDRKSETLGAAPPDGAVVLFNGTEQSLSHWTGKNVALSDDGCLQQGVTSKQTFGSCKVHIEFRLPFMPHARGQGRGNSGIYLQGRYEVQMLDSFGLEGEHNECGGIYKIAKPLVNMCYPPLSWQTYDIEFTAAKYEGGKKVDSARMTVVHNGVKIHDNIEVGHATTASPQKESADPGPIFLQNHGNPVRYRNVWVLPTDGATPPHSPTE